MTTAGRVDWEPLARERLAVPAPEAAVALLGCLLVRTEDDGSDTLARIVETEAYRQDDPASHSYAGRTRRTEPMFGPPGTSYVYRSYGVHWCLNVAVEEEGVGAAVLLRAARVLTNHDLVRARRPTARTDRELLRGPGRLAAGLDLDAARHDGGDLIAGVAGLRLAADGPTVAAAELLVGPRTGIRQAPDKPWRFAVAAAPEVSPYRRHPRADERP